MKQAHHIVLLLVVILDSTYGKFLVLGPVVATAGEDAVLECQLVPEISASNMVVQWFKSGLDSPVHVYRNGEDDIVAQHRNYRGRTELLKYKLTKGTISLGIKNTTIFDAGEYTCLVDATTYSDETAIILKVEGAELALKKRMKKNELSMGTGPSAGLKIESGRKVEDGSFTVGLERYLNLAFTCPDSQIISNRGAGPKLIEVPGKEGFGCEPWIQMKGYHKKGIELVCKSSGWYPRPEIQWVGDNGYLLTQAETRYQEDSKGLVNVQTDIVVTRQSTNGFKCRILSKHFKTAQEVTIRISDDMFPADLGWFVPLLVNLCCLIVAVPAVIFWIVKNHRHIKELELRKPFIECEWKRICDYEVSVNLDVETASPELEVSEDLKSLRRTRTRTSLPDTGKRFTDWFWSCVLGSEGFTSGRHYWEVEVEGNWAWGLGVAAESVKRDEVSLSPETGFWTIERFGDEFYIKSSPGSRLPVGQIPGKVGVYLSYESGTVSFYSADTKSHLHSFTGNKFTEKLYPFFWTRDEKQFLRICSGSGKGAGPQEVASSLTSQ
ncbi:butyrophilin subfamily 3 member A3-like [Carcharodon carcharias]|uniref:butyrophilin subfamily 3 member A3-like n=1 Tax=Carcharodon carcharias TaxID=13397 RepID=UPI001B7E3788|nr:butyrophilin subfamily 3 member A3-like [Carcharodon carcharias]